MEIICGYIFINRRRYSEKDTRQNRTGSASFGYREEQEMQIFEIIMLLCFGMSWPISVYKSIRSRSTKGKSAVFIIAIIIGYISGIIGKVVNHQLTYVVVLYLINLIVVSVDLGLYFVNAKREKNLQSAEVKQ